MGVRHNGKSLIYQALDARHDALICRANESGDVKLRSSFDLMLLGIDLGRSLPGRLFSILGSERPHALRKSFDASFYLRNNADVAKAGLDPFEHFMHHGWIEGRNPSPTFNTLFYRDKYLTTSNLNPLLDYLQRGGRRSGLRPEPDDIAEFIAVQRQVALPYFSFAFYSGQVADVDDDYLTHYLSRGWQEDLWPASDFDPGKYTEKHAYLKGLGVSPLYHFASQKRFAATGTPSNGAIGPTIKPKTWSARRNFSSETEKTVAKEFDAEFYLAINADVRASGGDPLKHFCLHGWREGRAPNRAFDCEFYLRAYPEASATGMNPFYHYLTTGRAAGLKPHPAGYRLYPPMRAPSDAEWAAVTPAARIEQAECVVIMPVYKGRHETLAAIYAVLASPQRHSVMVHVIDDQSPDPDLSADLQALSARGLFRLDKNERNLGFVATVNKALRIHTEIPVILLNTDAKVSGDWIDRMLAHAARDPRIATITPLSNNATIFSYPQMDRNNTIEMESDAGGLDRLAAVCNAGRVSDMPTGVGFCFFMSAAGRHAVGLLDEESFGKGYGEENDFCLRVRKAGYRNVAAEDIFVYHIGQTSFGAPDLIDGVPPGQIALIAKHPEYPDLIRQYLKADNLEAARIRLDLMRLATASGSDAVVFVYHALSGGILTHLHQEEEDLRKSGRTVIHVRVGVGSRWGVEIRSGTKLSAFYPNLQPTAYHQIETHLADFLRWLQPSVIHVHSLVGFDWGATSDLLDLIAASATPYRFTLHDYAVVCHRHNLVRPDDRYCALPGVETCRDCVRGDRSYPEAIDPLVRRNTYSRFLEGAETVYAPSRDIAERLRAVGATYPIVVQPHAEDSIDLPALMPLSSSEMINIVTIGAIGAHKGSNVLRGLARDATARGLPIRYHIVGYSDHSGETAAAGVTETGEYADVQEAFELISAINPSCILLPSIWPETFSYTLSMAFALKCTPVVFDLGAQAERVRDAGVGVLFPYSYVDNIRDMNDAILALDLSWTAGLRTV